MRLRLRESVATGVGGKLFLVAQKCPAVALDEPAGAAKEGLVAVSVRSPEASSG